MYSEAIGDPTKYSEQVPISEHANNYIEIDKIKAKHVNKKAIEISGS